MPRFTFSISSTGHEVRKVGVVQSDDFAGALTALEQQMAADAGDVLEIGVPGFPPAKFQASLNIDGAIIEWHPHGRLAA